ncbi:ARM repeat-containing protein [Auricularia subglabra TFB-10046 SS5]|nr:ARM repeat-containing protein [Auricularia subglabra TFB-10046 SS5]
MDPQSLSSLFATTYNPDPNVRKAAELEIRRLGGQEGMLAGLIQVIGTDGVDVSVRLACAVYLKNRIRRAYFVDPDKPLPDQNPILPSDRNAIRQHIFPLIVAAPTRSIRAPLAECLRSLISHDYPEKWPTLLDEIKALLQSARIQEVVAGCVAVLELAKAFRYRPGNELTHSFVPQIFPILVNIALQLLAAPPPPLTPASPEIPTLLHLILKTYKQTLSQSLSPHQQSADSIVPWGRLLFQVVSIRLPKEIVPENEDARENCEWWKAKKWAYGCLNRLFTRYGNPSQLPETFKKEYLAFAQHFVSAFAPEIFKMYLNQVELFVSGQEWISRKCQCAILSYFGECVKPKSTWLLLKPHFMTLVSSFIFPHLCFTEQHRELWTSDPIEYARMSIDEYEDFTSPVSASTFFLLTLARARAKVTFIPVLSFVNSILGDGSSTASQRYGALKMTAILVPHMVRNPAVRPSLEPFLRQHVLPAYAHPEGFMRNIALDVLVSVEKNEYRWPAPDALEPHFRAAVAALDDPDLPTRIQAAIAISEMVGHHQTVRTALSGNIGKVVQDMLKLSDETDMDILNSCMEVLVEWFDKELMPVATQLAQRLCSTYMRLVADVAAEEPDESDVGMNYDDEVGAEDKTFMAMGTAKTLRTIISSLENQKDILLQVQEIIVPIIVYTLSRQSVQAIELYDNMFDLVDGLTFTLRIIQPSLWPVFELTYQRFKTNAADFLDEMLPSLENFMTWGQEAFIARQDYRDMVVDIYVSAMTNEHLGAADRCNASKLIEAALLNLRGHLDHALPTIVNTALHGIKEPDHVRSARLANLQVLINAVLYNAPAALQLMGAAGQARAFFDKWFTAVRTENGLPRVHDKKLSIVALCELLKVPGSAVPEDLREGWTGIVGAALVLLKELPGAIAKRQALEEAFQKGDDSDEEDDTADPIVENEDDEGDVWDEDSAYIDFLAKEAAALRKSGNVGDDESDLGSVESDDVEEELGYLSPLETVNPYTTFKHALTTLQTQNAAVYQASTTSLTIDEQTFLMEVMKMADAAEQGVPAS